MKPAQMTGTRSLERRFKTQEFAQLAGVSVRTLHHYDQLGLLKPGGRTEAGYRLYRECDLARLEQITVLKFLGLSLKRIGEVLGGRKTDLGPALRLQLWALEEKRRRLDAAVQAIREASELWRPGVEPDWAVIKNILKVIEMQNSNDWMMKYYDPEARAKVEARKSLWNPELQERVSRQWAELFSEINASLGEDPSSPKAQALADRWNALIAEFTGGDPGIAKGLRALYSDQQNWPEAYESPVDSSAAAFIQKVNAARGK